MRISRSFLAAVIILSLVASGGQCLYGKTASAENVNKKIVLKAASDFTLELPASWKNNYVLKKSKNKKHSSYVAFYSKKCYKQTTEGWLFSITRYKDSSYTEMPSYELVGKWNGYNYVAVFPTDVQTMGATKAARKQYKKLSKSVEEVARSVAPRK